MAPSVNQMTIHFGTPDAVADAIHTITVDDAHMVRAFLTLQQLVDAVICPASTDAVR